MNADTLVMLLCSLISFASASYLVVQEDYDDGAFGRVFLVAAWLASLIVGYAILVVGERFESDALMLMQTAGLTLFMARSAVKFFLWHRFGVSAWRPRGCKQGFGRPSEAPRVKA